MTWHLEYTDKAMKQLRKLDRFHRKVILSWMDKNIEGCENPRVHGKGLVETHSGEWRYRIGDYRVLCDIQDKKLVVLAFNIEHRRMVYQ